MKKFMRIALVFALAGATLMYTGCTKDYSGDISDLNNQLGKQEAAITTLQAQVVAAQETANKALEAAKEADDKAAIADLEAKVKALAEAQAKIDDVIDQIKKDTKADVDKALAEIKAEVDALIKSLGVTSLEAYGDIRLAYAEFNGVFKGHKAATWKGEKELPAKGSIVTSDYEGYIVAQVTPDNYDLAQAELSVEDIFGNEAPVEFTEVVPVADASEELVAKALGTKAVSTTGCYVLGYKATDLNFDEDAESVWAPRHAEEVFSEKVALVAGNARSSYHDGLTATVWEAGYKDFSKFAFDPYDVEVSEATGVAEVYPIDYDVVYDFYIDSVAYANACFDGFDGTTNFFKTTEEAVEYLDIKVAGQTVTYDVAKAQRLFSKPEFKGSVNRPYVIVAVAVNQLNIAGYIKEGEADYEDNPCFYISADEQELPEREFIEFDWAATYGDSALVHQAQFDPRNQKLTLDMTEILKAWGVDKSAIFEANYDEVHPCVENTYFFASDDDVDGTSFDPWDMFDGAYFDFAEGELSARFQLNYHRLHEKILNKDGEWVRFDPIGNEFYADFEIWPENEGDTELPVYVVKNVKIQVTEPDVKTGYAWTDFAELNKVAIKGDTISINVANPEGAFPYAGFFDGGFYDKETKSRINEGFFELSTREGKVAESDAFGFGSSNDFVWYDFSEVDGNKITIDIKGLRLRWWEDNDDAPLGYHRYYALPTTTIIIKWVNWLPDAQIGFYTNEGEPTVPVLNRNCSIDNYFYATNILRTPVTVNKTYSQYKLVAPNGQALDIVWQDWDEDGFFELESLSEDADFNTDLWRYQCTSDMWPMYGLVINPNSPVTTQKRSTEISFLIPVDFLRYSATCEAYVAPNPITIEGKVYPTGPKEGDLIPFEEFTFTVLFNDVDAE